MALTTSPATRYRRGALALLLVGGAMLAVASPALAGVVAERSAQSDDPTTTTVPATSTAPLGESINVRLFAAAGKQRPIEGVTVIVRQEGKKVGEAESDADGLALIPVPGPGTYEVSVDRSTIKKEDGLPERLSLASVIVQANRAKFVLFPFGDRGTVVASDLDRIVDLAGSGLRFGLIVAVAAVGLSLVYGTTGLINFAHGELLAFGAIVAWYLNSPSQGLGLTLVIAGTLAVLLGGVLGGALEVGLWRPLRKRRTGNVALLVVSIGLALFLRSVFQVAFGAAPRSYSQYAVQSSWSIGPLDILPKSVATIVICTAILVVVALLLLRTRLGTAVRAVTDNSDLAESSGIDVQRVILAVWIACGALAAAAGVLLGMTQTVEYDMGFKVLLVIFAAMILGGLGSAFGAMVGGALLGLVLEIGTFWIPTDFKNAIALAMLIIVLLFRPQGILGVRERIG